MKLTLKQLRSLIKEVITQDAPNLGAAVYTVEITPHEGGREGFTAALYVDGIDPDQYEGVFRANRSGQGLVRFKPLWKVPPAQTEEGAHEQLEQRITAELAELQNRQASGLTARESARIDLLEGYFEHQAKVVYRKSPRSPGYGAPGGST